MNELQAAWDANNDNPNEDTLAAFVRAVNDALRNGVYVPDDMMKRYKLATGARPLPTVTVTASRFNWLYVAAAGLAAWWLLGNTGDD